MCKINNTEGSKTKQANKNNDKQTFEAMTSKHLKQWQVNEAMASKRSNDK